MIMHAWGMQDWGALGWPLLALWIGSRLVFWAMLIAAMVFGVRWLRRQSRQQLPTPLDTLRMRYARGELSRQEFESMRRDLE